MRVLPLLLLTFCAISTAWSQTKTTETKPPAAAARGRAVGDAALEQAIQTKFAKSKAGGGKFTVKVSNGTAYLSGRADVVQHKGAATRMARTSGAKQVVNSIVVTEAAKQKAARNLPRSEPRKATVRMPGA